MCTSNIGSFHFRVWPISIQHETSSSEMTAVTREAAANELSHSTGDTCITCCAHLNDVSSQTSERLDHTWYQWQTV